MQYEAALEAVQLQLLLDVSDFISEGFESALLRVVDELGGRLVFNKRLDRDPDFQRVAVVSLDADRHAILVFLDHAGISAHTEMACNSRHGVAREAMAAIHGSSALAG